MTGVPGQGERRGNHTPGPWLATDEHSGSEPWRVDSGSESYVNDGWIVASLWGPDAEHNARLIAAAPDLLEALEYAVNVYGKPGGPWNIPADPGGWLDRARTAIAKVRGE